MAVVAVGRQQALPGEEGRRQGQHHLQSLAFLVPGADLAAGDRGLADYRDDPLQLLQRDGDQGGRALQLQVLVHDRRHADRVPQQRHLGLGLPFVVTVIGLVFAVLSERIRWATAFKTVIFLPIVFSVTASSLVFTQIFELDPHVGVMNAIIQTVEDWFNPPGAYPLSAGHRRPPSLATSGVAAGPHGTLESTTTVSAGGTVRMGLTGISPDTLTVLGARPARVPTRPAGAVTGLVWRDFSLSNPTNVSGVFPDEDGFPNLQSCLARAVMAAPLRPRPRTPSAVQVPRRRRWDVPRPDPGVQFPTGLLGHLLARPAVADSHQQSQPDGAGAAQRSRSSTSR